jgi:uncharacterized protein with HEPN domain
MEADIKTWLYHILNAIGEINSFTESINDDFANYLNDTKTRRAVEWDLSIIGEAMNRIAKRDPSIRLTDLRLIIAARNKIIHGYEEVSDRLIWTIVHEDLPLLRNEIQELLEGEPPIFTAPRP